MADVNIGSFDFNAEGAIRAIGQLSKNISDLEKQMIQLQKEGKDTTAVQQQLAQATTTLDKALKQETTTMRGAIAQQQALQNSTKKLGKETGDLDSANRRLGAGLGRSLGGFKNLTSTLTRGAVGISNLVGGFGLAGAGLSLVSAAADKAVTAFISLFQQSATITEQSKKLAESQSEVTQQVVEETRVSNAYFDVLRDGQATQDQRNLAFEKLAELYPDVIGKTDLLKLSNEQLDEVQKRVNESSIRRIAIAAQESFIAETIAKSLDNTIKLRQRELQLAEAVQKVDGLATASSTGGFASIVTGAITDLATGNAQAVASVVTLGKEISDLRAENEELAASLLVADESTEKLIADLSGLSGSFGSSKKALSDLNQEIAKDSNKKASDSAKKAAKDNTALAGTLAALRQRQSELNRTIEERTRLADDEQLAALSAELKTVNKAVSDAQKRLAELRGETGFLSGSLADLRAQSAEVRKALEEQTSPEDAARIAELKGQYAELERQIKALEKALAATAEPSGFLEGIKANNSAALEEQKAASQRALSQLRAQQAAANLSVQQQRNAELQSARGNEEQIAALKEKFAAEDAVAERDQALAVLRIREQLATAELALAQKVSGAFSEETAEAKADLLDIQTEIAALEGKEFTATVTVKTDEESLKKNLQDIASFAQDLAGQVADFAASQVQNTIAQLDSAIDKQKSLLDELLGNEETANAAQVQLEKDRLDALNKERERAKNKEALIIQAQIAANLALAIARAVVEGGVLASALTVAAAIATATFGFIQAKQAAQNAFYKGTLSVDDPSAPNGRDTVPALLTKKEAVIPVRENIDYHPTIEGVFHRRVPAALANDFFTNTDTWVEAMESYKNGEPAPKITIAAVRQQRENERAAAMSRTAQNKGDALPLATAMGYIGKVISDQNSTEMRGDKLVKVVRAQSSKLDKLKGKSKGKNA